MSAMAASCSYCLGTTLDLHGSRNPRDSVVLRAWCKPISRSRAFAVLGSDAGGVLLPARRRRQVVALAAQQGHLNFQVEQDKGYHGMEQQSCPNTLGPHKQEFCEEQVMPYKANDGGNKSLMTELVNKLAQLKIQAVIHCLIKIARDIGEEVHGYATGRLSIPKKDDKILDSDIWIPRPVVRDFHVALVFGGIRFLGGLINYVLIRSNSIILFSVIPGWLLCELSYRSCLSWSRGQSALLFIYGQTVIAVLLFIREWLLFSEFYAISTLLSSLVSGAVVAFFIKKIVDRSNECGSLK